MYFLQEMKFNAICSEREGDPSNFHKQQLLLDLYKQDHWKFNIFKMGISSSLIFRWFFVFFSVKIKDKCAN